MFSRTAPIVGFNSRCRRCARMVAAPGALGGVSGDPRNPAAARALAERLAFAAVAVPRRSKSIGGLPLAGVAVASNTWRAPSRLASCARGGPPPSGLRAFASSWQVRLLRAARRAILLRLVAMHRRRVAGARSRLQRLISRLGTWVRAGRERGRASGRREWSVEHPRVGRTPRYRDRDRAQCSAPHGNGPDSVCHFSLLASFALPSLQVARSCGGCNETLGDFSRRRQFAGSHANL